MTTFKHSRRAMAAALAVIAFGFSGAAPAATSGGSDLLPVPHRVPETRPSMPAKPNSPLTVSLNLANAGSWLISQQVTSGATMGAFPWTPGDTTQYANTQGATAQGLLNLYKLTGSPGALAAAVANGQCQINSCIGGFVYPGNGTHRFATHDPLFLIELSQSSGDPQYAQFVMDHFWTPLANGTYGDTGNNYTAATWANYVLTARTGQGYPELVAWDLSKAAIAAQEAGQTAAAQAIMVAIQASINAADASHKTFDVIGLTGGIWASNVTGVALNATTGTWAGANSTADLAADLANFQAPGGGFVGTTSLAVTDANADNQTTGYAMLALSTTNRTTYLSRLQSAANFVTTLQQGSGEIVTFNGATGNEAGSVESHGEALEAYAETYAGVDRWVAPTGADTGDCSIQASPCQTIAYAISQAGPSNTIHIASGVYDLQSAPALTINMAGLQLLGEGATQPQIKRTAGGNAQALLVVNNVKNVKVHNLEFDMDQTFVAEGIIANGFVDGLVVDGNHFVNSRSLSSQNSDWHKRIAVSINDDNGNTQNIGLGTGSSVSVTNNLIDGVADLPNGVFLRLGVDMDSGVGTISGNTIAAAVHDIRVRFATTVGASSGTATLIDNNTLNGRGLEFAMANASAGAITISNNHGNAPPGLDDTTNYDADYSLVRLMGNPNNLPVTVSGNTFAGYRGHYRGVLVENFPNTTFSSNTFTPATGANDFVSLVVSNKAINSDAPPDAPLAMSITADGNTFNGSGVAGAGTAVEFLNDNDAGGTATFGSLMFGAGTPNTFDDNLHWYFHLDDYNCETTSGSPLCVSPPLPNYNGAIGNSATVNTDVRPFASNVSAANNSFAGKLPSAMNATEQGALFDRTYDKYANSLLGLVDYGFGTPTVVYVDDDFSGSFGDTVSFAGNAGTGCGATGAVFGFNAFKTITDAIAAVQTAGTVCVAAGEYAEHVQIDKAVNLFGAQAGSNAGVGSNRDGGTSATDSVVTAIGSDDGAAIIDVSATGANTIIDGFTIDGNNASVSSTGIADVNGVDVDSGYGIWLDGAPSILVTNSVLRNFASTAYVAGGSDGSARGGDRIESSLMSNAGSRGALAYNNTYASVVNDRIQAVPTGVQINNNHRVNPLQSTAPGVVDGNQITASYRGIFYNLIQPNASPYSVTNNVVHGLASVETGQWQGIWLESLYGNTSAVTVSGNTVDGSAVDGSRNSVGYLVNNIASATPQLAIQGGSVSNVDVGTLVTDSTYYNGAVSDTLIDNVTFADIGFSVYYVEESDDVPGSAKLTIGNGNDTSAVATATPILTLSGTAPQVVGPLASRVYVRSAHALTYWNGTIPNSFPVTCNNCTVSNASINTGIADAASGGTVTVEAGTFTENVLVNKSVTLKGAFAGTAGNAGGRGSNESELTQATRGTGIPLTISAANVTVDGMAINHVTGAEMVLLSSGAAPTRDNIKLLNNRLDDYIADRSSSVGFQIGTSSNLEISGNWLGNFANGPTSGNYAMGIRLDSSANAHVHDNTFWNVQSVNVQVNQSTGAIIENNAIDATAAPGTGNAGVQVANNNNVTVRGNTIAHVDSGLLVTPNNTTTVSLYCNTVTDSSRGLYALGAPWSGTHTIGAIFDNRIEATTLIQTNWSAGELTVGSNYYGGATPINVLVNIADPLSSSPIGQGACGDNTPTQVVAYQGSGQTTPINTAFTNPLVARVQDALGGAVMAAQTITFTPPGSGASATLGTASGSTNFNGVFSTTATANGLAGSYTVTASNGTLSTSPGGFALTNGKGTGTVVWDVTSFVYTGSNVTPTAHIAEESGATCVFTPTSVGPNVGSYPVSASCDSANYTATGNTMVSITPATATLSLSHLVQAYDGAPKSVLVTTTPVGVGYSVSYVGTGSTTYGPSNYPPVAVGTYTATASVNDQNYTGTAVSATLQIVTSNGDISLVVNGPIDPIHVGDYAQFAATMLANPALHTGQTYAYEVVLSKSGGSPLAVSDIASMEVFYQGNWVDVTTLTGGTLPFTLDLNNHTLVYTFPDGISGYTNGFDIQDPSWTWNVRFTFATTGTYTGSWTLENGVAPRAPVSPLVSGSAAVVVQPALPPTDIHLALGGPVENQQANTPVEYTATMLADPTLHTGEKYFVKVTIAKVNGTHNLTAADLAAVEVYYMGSWQPLPAGSFQLDVNGNLVYFFPADQLPGGFTIDESEWTWNFRFTYADIGTYTATAEVIHASDANNPSPTVFASDALSTTVVPQVIVPPAINLVLAGPLNDIAVGAPAEYTGTLVADPNYFTGRTFYVRVRLSKNGGADQMTTADLTKLELYQGGTWVDATSQIEPVMVQDGQDLVYYFPQPNAAFSITSTQWTWHFRFTYADVGVFSANADVIDSTDLPLLNAASLANASVATNVVAMPPDVALDLQGPVSGTQTGVPTAFTARLTNTAGAVPENAVVQFQIGRAGGNATTSDLALEYFDGSVYQPLPLAVCSGDPSKLCGTFGPVSGFPIGAAYDATTALRATFATADTWTVQASVVGVPSTTVYASDTLITQVTVTSAQVTLNAASLHVVYDGAAHAATATTTPSGLTVAFTYDGSPTAPTNAGSYNVVATITQAGYAGSTSGTLVIDPAPITVTLSNLTQTYDGSAKSATVSMSPSVVPVSVTYDGSVVAPSAVGSYTVVAIVTDPNYTGSASGTLTINPIAVTVTLSNLAQTYDGTQKAATVATNPNGITTSVTYDGVANAPIAAGSYNVVATVTQAGYSGSASGTLVIAKAPATVTLSNLTQPFNGLPRPVTATTLPASLPTSVTYDGSIVVPSAVGTYSVFAVVTDPNYSGSASGTLTIESNAVTVTLSNLAQTYDGTAKSATVSTSPNATTSVTYDGSPTAPTNAGSYNVVATVTQAGYSGSASGTLVIAKAAATVTLSNLTQTFDGTAKSATVMTTPVSLATSVTYDGGAAPSAIGSYTVVATVTDPNYTGSASGTLNIVAADAPDLSISISDDRGYVQYGKLLTYRIAVNNIGNVDVNGASISVPLPNTVLGANPGWTCIPLGTATCGSGGNGALNDTANIPANGGVVYLLNVWAKDDPSLTTDVIQMQASVTATGDVNTANDTATDITTMVIFRDGFEAGGDGAEPAATVNDIVTIGGVDANTTQFIDLSSAWASSGNIVRIASIAAGSQDNLVVQAVRIDGQLLVRLAGIADGKPLVGVWSAVPAGTNMLAIGLAAAKGESVLIVTGASEDLTASLSGAATSMTVFGAKP